MPRSSCDRMIPELPRAPAVAPRAMAVATSCAVPWDAPTRSSAAATAARMVASRLVPVSASGMGNTLSELISSRRSASPSRQSRPQSISAALSIVSRSPGTVTSLPRTAVHRRPPG
ncbi:Uncharacterised protein [Mycobacteroides abscessus subsp. abscessus]|nr:Uncharacterised protein [Mycobacteroides abscessus subsp. abscessus]